MRDLWRRLQVRDDDQDTLVLLNQASRKREVQPDLARKVVGGRLAQTTIPADFAAFEAAVNTGSPARMEDQKLRGALRGARHRARGAARARRPGRRRRRVARPAGPALRRARPDERRVRRHPAAAADRDHPAVADRARRLHVHARRPRRPRGRPRAGDRHDRHQEGPAVRRRGGRGPAEGVEARARRSTAPTTRRSACGSRSRSCSRRCTRSGRSPRRPAPSIEDEPLPASQKGGL